MINLIGTIISSLTFLVLAISMYFASTKMEDVSHSYNVTTNETVAKTKTVSIDNRSMTPYDGTQSDYSFQIPGPYDSRYNNTINITSFSSDFLASDKVSKIVS